MLPVVIVNLKDVIGVEVVHVSDKESHNLLQQRVVYLLSAANETFVDFEARVFNVAGAQEDHHAVEYPTPFLTAQARIFLFAPDQWACMDAMVSWQSHEFKVLLKDADLTGNVAFLIVKNHAYKIVAGR